MAAFTSGMTLSRALYRTSVRGILEKEWPNLRYSVGLVGWGSDVLGYDTPRSTDHMWGPRLIIFVDEKGAKAKGKAITEYLRWHLPSTITGVSTHFGPPDGVGVRLNQPHTGGPVEHLVEVTTPSAFLQRYLRINNAESLTPVQWLNFDQQNLLEVTAGEIFHDGLERLHAMREALSYFPNDVWRHHLAHAWQTLADEITFPGRCAELADELGWRTIVARQVNRLMQVCFLLERRYAPYAKWFGTAFAKLRAARKLDPMLNATLAASNWKNCESKLVAAYEYVARKHNRLGITPRQPDKATLYHGRPYRIIWADRFAEATRQTITNPLIRQRTKTKPH